MTEMKFEQEDAVAGMTDELKNVPIGPVHGIAAIALNMALKYHDITTVQDGTLYQQFKLEGKNMHPLHMHEVFETAIQIEKHLIGANKRIVGMLVDALEVIADEISEETVNQSEDTKQS